MEYSVLEQNKGNYILASIVTLFICYGVAEDVHQGFTSMRGNDYLMGADAPIFWGFVIFRLTILVFLWAYSLGKFKT
ncbi:hypothetical protein A2I98_11270 [Pseudoalteromonas agarivorans]|uniref:Uncharacterized protein n=1 Tax=Pseudoalteromonas agarivorans TaxID=176102 RepID=A0ABR5VTM7_9GAMM|nr:hypothetical protein [Pseudoalteromonas telluritireducens]KYL34156.1 hypothetical protein A2I98_11270 [Pseudoalteromonas telluritireducens]